MKVEIKNKVANLSFNDFDIAKIEAAHDLLLDNGLQLFSVVLVNLRNLTGRMYYELDKKKL